MAAMRSVDGVVATGMKRAGHGCLAQTRRGSTYPQEQVEKWAELGGQLLQLSDKEWAEQKRRLLLLAGDVETNPGPHGRTGDVLLHDVQKVTAKRYDVAVRKFEDYLEGHNLKNGLQDVLLFVELSSWAVKYLRWGYESNQMTAGHAGNLISGLTRLLYLVRAMGVGKLLLPDNLRPLWNILNNWRLAIPEEFRKPVRIGSCVGYGVVLLDDEQAALGPVVPLVLPLPASKGANVHRSDVIEFSPDQQRRYPQSVGLVRLRASKTARSGVHGRVQAVVIEDIVLARLATKVMPEILRDDEALWPFGRPPCCWSGSTRCACLAWVTADFCPQACMEEGRQNGMCAI